MRAFWAAHVRWLAVLALVPLAALYLGPLPAAAQTGTISGTVTDGAPTPNPISGVTIMVTDSRSNTLCATTDGSGRYNCQVAAGSGYSVTAARAGFSFADNPRQPVDVTEGQISQVYFAASYLVAAAVTDGVTPASAITGVTFKNALGDPYTGATYDPGTHSYFIPVATPGTYTLRPEKTEWTFTPTSLDVAVTAGSAPEPVHFVGTFWYRVYLPLTYRPYDLKNGDFESALDQWQPDPGSKLEVGVSPGDYRSPTHSLLLGSPSYPCWGGVPVGYARVNRSIAVPDSPGVTLSFWYRIITQDKMTSNKGEPLDTFEAAVNGAQAFVGGNTGEATGCDRPPTDLGWKYGEISLDSYRGKTVTLSFTNYSREPEYPGATLGYWNTYVYVDDVSVNVR